MKAKAKRTLFVTQTTRQEITKKWGFEPPFPPSYYAMKQIVPGIYCNVLHPMYIRCNRKGEINWDKAPLYTHSEIMPPHILILPNNEQRHT